MKALLRVFPTLMLMVVGATSFLLSYVAIRDVSIELGAVPASLAWAVPVCIDGGILAGSAAIWSSSYHRRRRDPLAFLTVATLLATSVLVNVSHAGEAPLAKWIAALPPLILLACLEIVAAQHRRDLSEAHVVANTVAATAETGASGDAPGTAPSPAASVEEDPETAFVPAAPPSRERLSPSAAANTVTETRTPAPASAPVSAPVGGSVEDRTPHLVPDLPSRPAPASTRTQTPRATATRPRRIAAAAPGEPAPLDAAAAAAAAENAAGGERVKALFSAHVDAGGDPQDRQLAQSLADQTGMSVQYVRRVLRPLRDQIAS